MIDPYHARVSLALEHATPAERAAADWYPRARREARKLARETGHTLATVLGVIAALSPRLLWEQNLLAARAVLERRSHASGALGANVRKAEAIRDGARPLSVLRGPKVRRFYRNLSGDMSPVTVDVHAARAAGAEVNGARVPAGEYPALERAYRQAAELHGYSPAAAQSVIWYGQRHGGQQPLWIGEDW